MDKNSSVLDEINEEVYNVLDDLGMKQHHKGYSYVAYAVNYLYTRLTEDVSMTKELYPAVARAFGTTKTRVERAIRHNIVNLLLHSIKPQILQKYFGNSVDPRTFHITNSQFLYTLSHRVYRNLRN